jgi:hypothetical protein
MDSPHTQEILVFFSSFNQMWVMSSSRLFFVPTFGKLYLSELPVAVCSAGCSIQPKGIVKVAGDVFLNWTPISKSAALRKKETPMDGKRQKVLVLLGFLMLQSTNVSAVTGQRNKLFIFGRREANTYTLVMMGYRLPRRDPLTRAFSACTWSEQLNRHGPCHMSPNSRSAHRGCADHQYAWIPDWDHYDNYPDADDCEP